MLKPSHLKALGKEIVFPTLAAGIYLFVDWHYSSVLEWAFVKEVSKFAVGFTALIFIQEQYQRVTKKVNDEEALEELRTNVTEMGTNISQILAGMRTARESEERNVAAPELKVGADAIGPDGANVLSFTDQATLALQKQLPLPAILVAAVGFEHAIVRAAAKNGGQDPMKGSLFLLRQMREIIGKDDFERLLELVALRNGLFHARPQELTMPIEDVEFAISEFKWGIDFIDGLSPQIKRVS